MKLIDFFAGSGGNIQLYANQPTISRIKTSILKTRQNCIPPRPFHNLAKGELK